MFNAFLGFDNSQLLTIKYCLHGAIPVVVSQGANVVDLHPYVKRDAYSEWLSELWVRRGVLKKTKAGIVFQKRVRDANKVVLSQRVKIKTEIIAEILSQWFNIASAMNKKTVFTEDMIVLTSCLNVEAFSSAILAELYICRTDWEENLKPLLSIFNRKTFGKCKKYFESDMRHSNVFTAMNSGRKKYLWFKKDEAGKNNVHKVIEEVSELFMEHKYRLMALNWKELWSGYLTIDQSQDFIDSNILECVGHIYCYNVCYRILEYLFLQTREGTKEKRKKIEDEIIELREEYNGICLQQSRIDYLIRMPNYMLKEGIEESFKKIYTYMLRLDEQVEEDMLSIEQYICKSSNQYVLKFQSCILFDFDTEDDGECMGIVTENLLEMGRKQIVFEIEESGFTRICVLFNDNNQKELILKLIRNVYSLCLNIKIHCMAIPVLPKGKEFRLNCKINSNANVVDFKEKVINPLTKKYSNVYPKENEILFVVEKDDVKNEPTAEDKNFIEKSGVFLKSVESGSVEIPFCKGEYSFMKYSEPLTTIGIIAMIPEEFNAIKNRYSMKRILSNIQTQRRFYEAKIDRGNKHYNLVLTQTQGTGNQAALSAYYGLEKNFNLDYIVLLGIAGSVNKKSVKIGDVVIAREVWDGQLGKETDDGFKMELKMYAPNAIVNSILIDFMNEANGKLYPNIGKSDDTFTCFYEPIADNGHLIGTSESKFVKDIREHCQRKIAAVEMECAGVSYGVYQARLDGTCENLIVIRGISDYADSNKSPTNKFHMKASENAVTILDELIIWL